MNTIEADYLVVGAGAMGMAFIDTLVSETDVRMVLRLVSVVAFNTPCRNAGQTQWKLTGSARQQPAPPELNPAQRPEGASIRSSM
jgi:hypothetical protein